MSRYPEAYIQYLLYFHAERDFFECHEVLEEYWKQEDNEAYRPLWHGLIQVAVSLYHERRGNLQGAMKMMQSAIKLLSAELLERAGIDGSTMMNQLIERLHNLEHMHSSYVDLNLPLKDSTLLSICLSRCKAGQLQWGAPSDMGNLELIHKHKLRDRSDVIHQREAAIQAKKAAEQ